eukprot:TRINITY_DN57811_c0_g1_i1.p1 TRINITY_DN57811_c0_g1~~TRINITY_DN57811_c0_g1_i1.p1  ORF type:complete len:620 (-),score=93.24 TRINITY_DN57811_c0_g1_i1:94-1902(-)
MADSSIASTARAEGSLETRLNFARKGPTLIFDGVCNLCNASMRWYFDRMRPESIELVHFMWAQHEDTTHLLKELGISADEIMKSWAYVEEFVVYRGSAAWFQAMRHLTLPWRLLSSFHYVPEVLREGAYGIVSASRYSMAGKSDQCQPPSSAMKSRFLHALDSQPALETDDVPVPPQKGKLPKLLVVGLGPSGLAVTRELASEYSVIAVEPKDFYEYTPGILRGFAEPSHLPKLQIPLSKALAGLGVLHLRGVVVRLDKFQATVKLFSPLSSSDAAALEIEDGQSEIVVSFDYAVLAMGSQYAGGSLWKVTGAEGEQEEARLEGRISRLRAGRERLLSLREEGGTLILVGAGLVGVELAAEVAHYLPGLKIILADVSQAVLPALPARAQQYATKWLTEHGVELRLGLAPLPAGKEAEALGVQGASVVLGCAGVRVRSEFVQHLDCIDERGAIRVNRMMQVLTRNPSSADTELLGEQRAMVVGAGRVFALGDCVTVDGVNPPLTKDTYPAEAMADVVVSNLRKAKQVQCLRTCPDVLRQLKVPLQQYTLCSLGPDDCVFVGNGSVWATGTAACFVKNQIESTKMGQYKQEFFGSLVWRFVPHW